MTPARAAAIKAVADAVWTAAAVGIILYGAREPIRKLIAERRAEIEARRAELVEIAARRDFRAYVRTKLIAEGTDPLIAEIMTAPDAPVERA